MSGRGRPRRCDEPSSERIDIRLTPSEMQLLTQIAKRARQSPRVYLRDLALEQIEDEREAITSVKNRRA